MVHFIYFWLKLIKIIQITFKNALVSLIFWNVRNMCSIVRKILFPLQFAIPVVTNKILAYFTNQHLLFAVFESMGKK